DQSTLSAHLTPVFYDNSTAINVLSHSKVALALTDPDTNYFMPSSSPRVAGDLATISQADGQIIFDNLTSKGVHLSVLNMTDNKAGNIPPLDDIAVATSGTGTLYVVDSGNNTILALNTKGWAAGTVSVSEPSDTK